MTDEEIVGQALVAGFMIHSGYGQQEHQMMPVSNAATLIEFARAIEAKVREECAVICDLIDTNCHAEEVIAMKCAEAIRARGKE